MPALHPLKLMQALDLMNFAESQSVNDISVLRHAQTFDIGTGCCHLQVSTKVQCNRVTKKKNPHIALSKFTVLHWAALKAMQEPMWPEGQRAGHT